MKKFFRKHRPTFSDDGKRSGKKSPIRGEPSKEKEVICYECKHPRHMWGECPKMMKKFKKMKSKKTRAMVATWSDEESDDSTNSQEEDKDASCLMAHGNEVEEVNMKEEESFSIDK